MKIIIVYATAGAGHKRAAQALKEAFDRLASGHDVRLIDCLDYTNGLFRRMYPWAYNFLVTQAPLAWGFFYYLFDFRPLKFLVKACRAVMNFINAFAFYRFIIREKPDCVIATHFLATEVVSNLKWLKLYRGKLITCVTDYGVHAFWVSASVDLYVVASEYSKKDLVRKGVSADRVRILGIPVLHRFVGRQERQDVLNGCGLSEGFFNILIMGGGFGVGPISELVSAISKCSCPFQVIAVCGKNQRLSNELKSLSARSNVPIKVFGFVDNVNELMEVSDVMISKPGGLGISEAFIKGLPILVTSCIPGHEAKNLKFLNKNGAGMYTGNIKQTIKTLQALYASRELLLSMKAKAKLLGKPSAADDAALLVLESAVKSSA